MLRPFVAALLLTACDSPSAPAPAASRAAAASVAPSATSSGPTQQPVTNASAPPPASAPPSAEPSAAADDPLEDCMSAELSRERAKPHQNAAPPYADCAAGVFGHCGPGQHYCSIPLSVKATAAARKKYGKVCCYGKAD